ncbi:7363_t:CDS:2, partial [Acaulospora morrowiae]
MKVSVLNSCGLRGFKRSRISNEESEDELSGNFKDQEFYIGKDKDTTGRVVEKEVKRMRLDLEPDASRETQLVALDFHTCAFRSESSSPKTPSPYSPFNATESSTQYHYHNYNQEQIHQSSRLQQNNSHKPYHYPLRISTRSDAYASSSDAEYLNPYANINSVLYLANLTRNSHIINELQGELGNMDIDERGLIGMSASTATHNSRHDFSNDGVSNNCDSPPIRSSSMSEYESINTILKDAFLKRHGSGL